MLANHTVLNKVFRVAPVKSGSSVPLKAGAKSPAKAGAKGGARRESAEYEDDEEEDEGPELSIFYIS